MFFVPVELYTVFSGPKNLTKTWPKKSRICSRQFVKGPKNLAKKIPEISKRGSKHISEGLTDILFNALNPVAK